jgi:hypothetical protein
MGFCTEHAKTKKIFLEERNSEGNGFFLQKKEEQM